MEEDKHKNKKFYQLPPVVPKPAPAPYVPLDGPSKPSGIFIENPKSLPTDLRKFEVKRNYWEQVKLVEEKPYVAPKVRFMKKPTSGKTIKLRKLFGGPLLPDSHEIHSMRIKAKDLDLKNLIKPLTLVRKEVLSYAELQAEERAKAAAEKEKEALAENGDGTKKDTVSNADITKIAPYGGAARNKKNMFKKRTKQIFQHNPDVRMERAREAKPWVLEDGNEKEVLRGTIDGAKEGRYFIFYVNKKTMKMEVKPVSRCYAFTERPKYRIPTLEECEAMQNAKTKKEKADLKKLKQGRAGNSKAIEDGDDNADLSNVKLGFKLNKNLPVSSSKFFAVRRDEDGDEEFGNQDAEDIDEIDFEENFQDDEEGADLEMEDDETKESARRIKKSQNRFKPSAYYSDDGDDDEEESDGEAPVKKNTKNKKRAGRDSDAASDSESQEEDDSDKDLPIIGRIDGEETRMPKPPAKPNKLSSTEDKTAKSAEAGGKPVKASKSGKASKDTSQKASTSASSPSKSKRVKTSADTNAKPQQSKAAASASGSKSTTTSQPAATNPSARADRITVESIIKVVRENPGRVNADIFNLLGLTKVTIQALDASERDRIKKLFTEVTQIDKQKIMSLRSPYDKYP